MEVWFFLAKNITQKPASQYTILVPWKYWLGIMPKGTSWDEGKSNSEKINPVALAII